MPRLGAALLSLSLAAAGAHAGAAGNPAPEGVDTRYAGVWSFDGSCASGDGMSLAADGALAYDEGGRGLWFAEDRKLHLLFQAFEPGLDEIVAVEYDVLAVSEIGPDLMRGRFVRSGRLIEAVRCAQP